MLIGIDASRAVTARRTGTENYSLHLIRHLAALPSEHRFRLYLRERPGPGLLPLGGRVAWRVMRFPRLWTHLRLSQEMMRWPPAVLFVPAHVLPLRHPPASVVTVHDLGYLHFPESHPLKQRLYLDLSTRFSARFARRLIADSIATRDDLVRCYGVDPARVDVVYLAADPALAPVRDPAALDAVRVRHGLPPRYVLFVGTLQPRKNVVRLVRAFRAVAASGDDAVLALAGKRGWLDAAILGAAREAGIEDRVRFLGYVPDDDLPALLSGALAFALPSLYEGFGLPALEAMACGTPALVSNVSSLPEVVGDAGLQVDPHSEDAISAALLRLCGDSALRADLARRGLERAATFRWERTAQATLRSLEAAAHSDKPPASAAS